MQNKRYLFTGAMILLVSILSIFAVGCAREENITYTPPDEAMAPSKEGIALQKQTQNVTEMQQSFVTMARYHDKVIQSNQKGRQMLNDLSGRYAIPISSMLYDHPDLMSKGIGIMVKHQSGLEKALNGEKAEVSVSEIAEVKSFLNELAGLGDADLRQYLNSIQTMLNKNDLESYGFKVVKDTKISRPLLKNDRLAIKWGAARSDTHGK